MTELEKIKQIFISIVGLCNEMTTANISHHRSTIKLQSEYGQEVIDKISEKKNLTLNIEKLIDKVEINSQNMNPGSLLIAANKLLDEALKINK